jgi:hypothetical protein
MKPDPQGFGDYVPQPATSILIQLTNRKLQRQELSVADPDPGSGAFLTPGSGIQNRFIPDLGSQTHIFESANFLGKKFYNSLKIGPNFFLQHF